MTYKQTLFFIGKCLTINYEKNNKVSIESKLKEKNIDWESVVKVSTSHYVLPALYCNLKKASFLNYLPEDLVSFMEHLTTLNRDRNKEIIKQAKEINEYLIKNEVTPIFLKGTGNLVQGLYEDIAERMVGDIDLIVSPDDYFKTIKLISKFGYTNKVEDLNPLHRHFPGLISSSKIASIEIHNEVLKWEFRKHFNYNFIKDNLQKVNNVSVLGYNDQIILSTLSHQINDNGFDFISVNLRNSYDIFLLSKKQNTTNLKKLNNTLQYITECYLLITNKVFNKTSSFPLIIKKKHRNYLNLFFKYLNNDKKRIKHIYKEKRKKKIKYRINQIKYFLINKQYRTWTFNKFTQNGL